MPETLAAEGDVLLSDNFNDRTLDGWTIEYGNWYVNPQGNLAGSNSGQMLGGKINSGNSEWDNYQIDLDINGFQGIDGGVGFRYTQNGNSYQLDLKFTPSFNYTPEAILRKTEDGTATTLGDTHSTILQGQTWYHLKIEANNDNIKVWINNDLIFDITDTGTKVKKGTIALNYWTGSIGQAYMKFDNVIITALAPPPPPRIPVIFIPGIGGSELKASQDIIWSKDDGHGGTYSRGYSANEKIWVNQNEAANLGNDDYFDVLRLKTDGVTSEADLTLTGDLTSFGYADIDSFFVDMGYSKGTNYFVFPYDWRKDIRTTKDSLDALIESVKTASGQPQVNLVVHSMGGLVARYYISDATKAAKVNKLIELGVPHLGSVDALKTLRYGSWLGYDFRLFRLGIPPSQTKDNAQNLPSIFELIPSYKYYDFYNNIDTITPYPYKDDRDIDNNNEVDALNFTQTKTLLSNLGHNTTVFNIGEQFHDALDPLLNQTNGTKVYEIVGTSQPTLGQIHETWWITWPVNLLNKTDELFINGDGTVPLYSASLKNDSLDISGATKIYYTEQEHGDLVNNDGTAMQTVRAILNDDNSLPVEVKDEKFVLEGEQLSLDDGELDIYDDQNRHCGLNDNGEIEENIPDVTCTTSGNTKHAFVKKKAAKVKVKATRKTRSTRSRTTNLKKRTYRQDRISKTIIYKDLNISQTAKIEFDLDPDLDTSPSLIFYPDSSSPDNTTINLTSEISGSSATDQTLPTTSIQISGTKDSSNIYTGPVTITLTGEDSDSGILKIEYSLDNGQTVQTYTEPFIISTSGKTTIQIKAIDNLGNEEIPQSIVIEIAAQPTPTPTPTLVATNTSTSLSASTPETSSTIIANTSGAGFDSPEVDFGAPGVLGIKFENPSHISDQMNVTGLLDQEKNALTKQKPANRALENLGGLLLVSGGIVTLASVGLLATFFKPIPK